MPGRSCSKVDCPAAGCHEYQDLLGDVRNIEAKRKIFKVIQKGSNSFCVLKSSHSTQTTIPYTYLYLTLHEHPKVSQHEPTPTSNEHRVMVGPKLLPNTPSFSMSTRYHIMNFHILWKFHLQLLAITSRCLCGKLGLQKCRAAVVAPWLWHRRKSPEIQSICWRKVAQKSAMQICCRLWCPHDAHKSIQKPF